MEIRHEQSLKNFKIPQSKYILIDCDVGGDDALCIILAKYLADKFGKQVIGITCVEGNTKLENVLTNSVISAKIAGLEVPIAKGAWKTILGSHIGAEGDDYFSSDGLGGKQKQYNSLVTNEDRKRVWKKKAFQGILLASHKYAHQLSILALGPLTNLAIAYMTDNSLPSRINSVSIMGGAYSTLGRHQHFCADFNFHLDPEAANIVIQNYKNIILTTIEFTSDFHLVNENQVFKNRKSLKGQFIADLYSPIIAREKRPVLCDPLASFPLFCPTEAQVKVYDVWGSVILNGQRTRGMFSIDWMKTNKKQHNNRILIISSMNREFVEKMTIESLK